VFTDTLAQLEADGRLGDGHSVLDEYRGWIVSTMHVRGDPGDKDIFVHLVNPDSGSRSLVDGKTTGGGGDLFTGADFQSNPSNSKAEPDDIDLFENLKSLISESRVHLLGFEDTTDTHGNTTEWVDRFDSYTDPFIFAFNPPGGGATVADGPDDDRQVNQNHVFGKVDSVTGFTIQKGARIIESVAGASEAPCPGNGAACVMGRANHVSVNSNLQKAVVNTVRIVHEVDRLIAFCPGETPQLDDYSSGAIAVGDGKDRRRVIAQMIRFISAMELGHSGVLTPTGAALGFHHIAGEGMSNLDQLSVYDRDCETSGDDPAPEFSTPGLSDIDCTTVNPVCISQTFSIPELFIDEDRSNFRVRN